jgi:hypothetical protein
MHRPVDRLLIFQLPEGASVKAQRCVRLVKLLVFWINAEPAVVDPELVSAWRFET